MQTKKMLVTHSRSIGCREKVCNVMILKNRTREGSNGNYPLFTIQMSFPRKKRNEAIEERRYIIKSEGRKTASVSCSQPSNLYKSIRWLAMAIGETVYVNNVREQLLAGRARLA